MPGTKVLMRKVREVLRLKHALGMSERLIADAVGVGKTAVGEYLRRARVLGLAWPLPDGLDDAELEQRLFTPAGFHDGPTKPLPTSRWRVASSIWLSCSIGSAAACWRGGCRSRWKRHSASKRWRMLWRVTASRTSSIQIRARSSPARPSPGCSATTT